MTKKPYWTLSDKEVAFWDSDGLFSGKSEEQKAVDECKRAIYKEIEPLFISILDFFCGVIERITDLVSREKKG